MASKESRILDTTGQDETQAQAIGTVVTVYGTAGIRGMSGDLTILEAGDSVYQNDVLATGEPGGLVVEFKDGSRLDLGRNSEATLDTEVYDASLAREAAEEVVSDPARIDAALEELDLDSLAPTAAGGNQSGPAGDEGSSFVLLDRSDQSTDPESGLDTDFLEQVFSEPPAEESVPPVLAQGPAPVLPVSDGEGSGEFFEQSSPLVQIDEVVNI